MPLYSYRAVSAAGDVSTGELEAANESEIVDRLRDQGLLPMQIAQSLGAAAGAAVARAPRQSLFAPRRVTRDNVLAITRDLATLLRAGLTLDNIRVPQLGLADGPGASGWTSHGWTRVANLLPVGWLVQLVLYTDHGVQVRQVPVSELGQGQATISGLGGDVKRAVLAISPTAPQTTIPSSYTLTVK